MDIKLWEVRSQRNITLHELEKMSGISKTTLNDIENGKVSPTIRTLEKIAKSIGCKINDLFESEYQ